MTTSQQFPGGDAAYGRDVDPATGSDLPSAVTGTAPSVGVPASNDPEAIRREIDATRRDLAANVDLLEEKVSPSKIVDRRVGRAKSTVGGLRDRVMGAASHGTDQAGGAASSAVDSTKSALSSAGDAVTSAPDTVTQQARGNPLAAGLIAFGLGALIGSVFAPSEPERKVAAQAKDTAQPAVTEAAQNIAQNVKEPAQQAVEQVKQTATEAGQHVADHAQSAASDVKDHATSAASDVKDTATSGGDTGTSGYDTGTSGYDTGTSGGYETGTSGGYETGSTSPYGGTATPGDYRTP